MQRGEISSRFGFGDGLDAGTALGIGHGCDRSSDVTQGRASSSSEQSRSDRFPKSVSYHITSCESINSMNEKPFHDSPLLCEQRSPPLRNDEQIRDPPNQRPKDNYAVYAVWCTSVHSCFGRCTTTASKQATRKLGLLSTHTQGTY